MRVRIRYRGIERWIQVPDAMKPALESDPRRDLAWIAAITSAQTRVRTADRYLEDADRSIAGWREAREDALGYHYPLQETA